jgi:hypothetical protein
MVFANVVGSIINDILPSGVILSILMVLILVGIAINVYNAVKRYKLETIKIKKKERRKRREEKEKRGLKMSESDFSTTPAEENEDGKVSLLSTINKKEK